MAAVERLNLREWFKSSHTLYLEAEVIRLRGEVRRLMDAALTREGLAPITERPVSVTPHTSGKPLPSQWIRKMQNATVPKDKPDAQN